MTGHARPSVDSSIAWACATVRAFFDICWDLEGVTRTNARGRAGHVRVRWEAVPKRTSDACIKPPILFGSLENLT